jgi:hypothetical protein
VSALSEALAPLYRAYLRRLDEMAGRIGAEAALREPLLRDDQQRPVPNDDGFATRFDLADARTGETFEVHGAHADEPAARDVLVGALTFQVEPANWEELTLRIAFGEAPPAGAAESLAELVRAWAVLAAHGGLAASAAPPGWSGRLHSAAVRAGPTEVVASLDLGTCAPAAVDTLADALGAFAREVAPLARVVIGPTSPKHS